MNTDAIEQAITEKLTEFEGPVWLGDFAYDIYVPAEGDDLYFVEAKQVVKVVDRMVCQRKLRYVNDYQIEVV